MAIMRRLHTWETLLPKTPPLPHFNASLTDTRSLRRSSRHHGRCFTRAHTVTPPQSGKVRYFDMAQLSSPLTTSALCSLFSRLLLPRSGVISLRPNRLTRCRPQYLRAVRPFSTTCQALLMSSSGEGDPLLGRLPAPVAVPPMLLQPGAKQLGTPAQISSTPTCLPPTFITPHVSTSKRKRPQCIAHRGYKAKYPENTLSAFRAAISAGAG